MSLFFGSSNAYQPVIYTGIQIQTSTNKCCLPIVYGANRIAPNLIWYENFQRHDASGGKGGGGKSGSYTYTADVILALCEGGVSGIHGVGKVWKDQSNVSSISALNFSLFLGTDPQTPWSYLTSNYPTQALGYNSTAYVGQANYDLGSGATIGSHNFEVQGLLYGSQVGGDGNDADPALVVQDFMTNPEYSLLIPTSAIDTVSLLSGPNATTTGDSAYQTYCRALGFGISPALIQQESGLNILERWMKLTNTAIFWSGYNIKFIPYGDQSITGNGVTYVPSIDPVYDLTDRDYFLRDNQDPVEVTRSDLADAYNSVSININDRSNSYVSTPVTADDLNAIQLYGIRVDTGTQASEICNKTMAATMVQLMLQRSVYIRNTYTFVLSWEYCLLEPMDIVTVTDVNMGLNQKQVRIISIDEDDQDNFTITAEEFNIGVGTANAFNQNTVTSGGVNRLTPPSPVNTPVIFEPPSSLTNGVAQVWIAVSGGTAGVADPLWGGAQVWISSDGTSYAYIGNQENPSIQGVLGSGLPAFSSANPDNTNTLSVNLQESAGELSTVSALNAQNAVTLCYVDGELMSFETATLVGTDTYNLTTLYRGLYGTTASSHAGGTQFARLDSHLFTYQLPPQFIGHTIYLKFASFNAWGLATQDLSACTAYTYTPVGTGFGGGGTTGGAPGTPTGLSVTGGAGSAQASWTTNPSTDNVTEYIISRANGLSQPFSSSSVVWAGLASAYTDTPVSPGDYTYFIEANNAIGLSNPSAGVNATVTSGTGTVGISSIIVASEALAANDLVNIWDNAGTANVRKADAPSGKLANGFVSTSVASGSNATVYFSGLISGLTGLAPGIVWLDSAGGIRTSPSPGIGDAQQPVGVCVNVGTAVYFDLELSTQSSVGSWIPLVDGADPPNFISDGAGNLILVTYT